MVKRKTPLFFHGPHITDGKFHIILYILYYYIIHIYMFFSYSLKCGLYPYNDWYIPNVCIYIYVHIQHIYIYNIYIYIQHIYIYIYYIIHIELGHEMGCSPRAELAWTGEDSCHGSLFFLVNKPGICASHMSGFVSSMHVAAWIMQQLWHYELRYIYIIIYIIIYYIYIYTSG